MLQNLVGISLEHDSKDKTLSICLMAAHLPVSYVCSFDIYFREEGDGGGGGDAKLGAIVCLEALMIIRSVCISRLIASDYHPLVSV